MQYYLVFPLLMIVALKLGRLAGMALLVAAMAAVGFWLDRNGYVIGAYSMLPMKFHLFAAGMLMAMTLRVEGKWKWLLILGAIAVIFVPLGGGRSFTHRVIKIGIVLGFLALLYRDRLPLALKLPTGWLDRLFSNRLGRWIGDVSYGVYLIHLLVMLPVAGWLALNFPAIAPFPRFALVLVVTSALTYGTAWLAYRFIEEPGIAFGRKVASRFRKPVTPEALPEKTPA